MTFRYFLFESSMPDLSNDIRKIVNNPREKYIKIEKVKLSKLQVFRKISDASVIFFSIAIAHLFFTLERSLTSHFKAGCLNFVLQSSKVQKYVDKYHYWRVEVSCKKISPKFFFIPSDTM